MKKWSYGVIAAVLLLIACGGEKTEMSQGEEENIIKLGLYNKWC